MSTVVNATTIFQELVDRWILEAIGAGSRSLAEVIRRLPGVYPGTALEALRGLQARGAVPADYPLGDEAPRESEGTTQDGSDPLPAPHPLDYDWRFARSGVEVLLDECEAFVFPHEMIALLGTPSLVPAITKRYPTATGIPQVSYAASAFRTMRLLALRKIMSARPTFRILPGMRDKGSPAELEHRRLLAVQRVLEGYSTQEVAEFLGVDPRSVRRWVAAYRQDGGSGLCARPAPGRPPKLTTTQEKIVRRWLAEKPTEHGFATDLWTGPRLAKLIHQEFGI